MIIFFVLLFSDKLLFKINRNKKVQHWRVELFENFLFLVLGIGVPRLMLRHRKQLNKRSKTNYIMISRSTFSINNYIETGLISQPLDMVEYVK